MNNSLDDIEGKMDNVSELHSGMIENCHLARTKKLKDLDTKDLRVLINQRMGLTYTIPLALNILEENPLVMADLYRGDLLYSILNIDEASLTDNSDWVEQLVQIKYEVDEIQKTLAEEIKPLLEKIAYD